jgi:hypothetical protein
MSLVSTFVDAFKKAAGRQPTKPDVDMKSLGPLGSAPESAGGSFDPLRPTPESDSGQGIDRGDVSVTGEPEVASGDPEEGGEVNRP